MGCNDNVYLDSPADWDALAERLRRAGVFGLDTEFYGLDVTKQSCVGLARVHVWSVAVRTQRLSPLGYHVARGWVLPGAALRHPSLKAVLEDPGIRKCVHNQPVDDHAIHNEGVALVGCVNTLGLARWVWPDLVTAGGFGLKNLMAVRLNRAPVCEFRDVVSWDRMVMVSKWKKVEATRCECGTPGCRLRKSRESELGDWLTHGKIHEEELVETFREKMERGEYPLESIVPGHERWDLLVKYSAEDAVAALEIEELCHHEPDPAAWPYGGGDDNRPAFNQAVENCVVRMERTGFPVDVPWCTETTARAEADEAKELRWLRKWYRANIGVDDGEWFAFDDDDVNAIWSSPKKLIALFDYLSFPRSPIWKKGRVKRGDVKTDGAAMEWIARTHKPAKQLIGHYLHLKKIRSQKKYLVKLRDSGGWVNVICGPAGDHDDRNGAVTGRLGIKGTLEAQQLPTVEDKDLYQVRRAIVANRVVGEMSG